MTWLGTALEWSQESLSRESSFELKYEQCGGASLAKMLERDILSREGNVKGLGRAEGPWDCSWDRRVDRKPQGKSLRPLKATLRKSKWTAIWHAVMERRPFPELGRPFLQERNGERAQRARRQLQDWCLL